MDRRELDQRLANADRAILAIRRASRELMELGERLFGAGEPVEPTAVESGRPDRGPPRRQ
jgi:hypothetical protein